MDTLNRYFFANKNITKIAENLAFETKHTIKHSKYILMPVADPQVMRVRLLQVTQPELIKNPKKPVTGQGLKPSTRRIFGVNMGDFNALLDKYGVLFFDEIPNDSQDALTYSCEDSDYAVQHYLYEIEIAKQVPKYYDWLHKIEMPFSRVIGQMEYWGMPWDSNLAESKLEEAEIMQLMAAKRIEEIGETLTGKKISAGKSGKTGDVRDLLFKYMELPPAKFGKSGPSLDEESLIDMRFMLENRLQDIDEEKYLAVELPEGHEKLDPENDPHMDKEIRMKLRISRRKEHPYKAEALELFGLLEKIQKYSTLISSHIKGRSKYLNEASGRVHAQYTPWTQTSRLNSFNPNGQNVPAIHNDELKIRNFYHASPGKILFFIDFSGFELRLIAWKSGDEVMIDIFKHNGDIHLTTASMATGKPKEEVSKVERTHAKPANFGIAYGGTEHALQKTFKTEYGIRKTLDECLELVTAVKKAYPRIPEYQRKIVLEAREKGYVETIYGYKRLLPDINSSNRFSRGQDERRSGNTPVQGSAADIMKKAQNEVYDGIGWGTVLFEESKGTRIAPVRHGSTDMIGQVHDEIIMEMDDDVEVVEAACKWIKEVMERPPIEGFPIPVIAEASVGYRWGEKMPVEKWLEERRGKSDL